jgi:serine/threonine protein phosphatase PrpC
MAGLDLDPASFATSIAFRMGMPILDDIPRFEYAPVTTEELRRQLNVVVKGAGGRYLHPKLPGMEFSEKDTDLAMSLVINADAIVMDSSAHPSENELVNYLQSNRNFQNASKDKDRAEQLKITLYNVAVLGRRMHLMGLNAGLGFEEADMRAREDVVIARTLVDDFRKLKSGEIASDSAPPEAERMLNVYRDTEFDPDHVSDFELALRILDNPQEGLPPEPAEEPVFVEPVEAEQPIVEVEDAERLGEIIEGFENLRDGSARLDDVPPESKLMYDIWQSPDFDVSKSSYELAMLAMSGAVEVPLEDQDTEPHMRLEPPPEPAEQDFVGQEPPTVMQFVRRNGEVVMAEAGKLEPGDVPLTHREDMPEAFQNFGVDYQQEPVPEQPPAEEAKAPEPSPQVYQEMHEIPDMTDELDEHVEFEEEAREWTVVKREGRYAIIESKDLKPSDFLVTGKEREKAMLEILKEEQQFGLVFPLPNIGTDEELEKMLDHHFPRYNSDGVENERHKHIRSAARTLANYVKFQLNGPEYRSQFVRFAKDKFGLDDLDVAVHPQYESAVRDLSGNYSHARAIALGMMLVDKHTALAMAAPSAQEAVAEELAPPIPIEVEAPAPPEHKLEPLLQTLSGQEKGIVVSVIRKEGECTAEDLEHFMRLHAGVRELRARNRIDSVWTSGIYGMLELREAKRTLYQKCSLQEPTPEQKMEAILQPNELTQNQLNTIAAFFKRKKVKPRHITKFGNWAREPGNRGNALNLWRNGQKDLFAFGNLVHKLRFTGVYDYTPEEAQLLTELCGGTDKEMAVHFVRVFTQKNQEGDTKFYRREVMEAYERFLKTSEGSLDTAAQRQAEIQTLLDFLGVESERPEVDLRYRDCVQIPEVKNYKTNPVYKNPCQDTISTITITREDGSKILIDAVIDGMGGHGDGARAATMAKEVLETAALAGWMKSAEGVRRALVLADLAILMGQVSDIGEPDLENPDTFEKVNDMGATAVVGFQSGNEFFGIHCGDSDYRVIRDGKIVFKSDCHSLEYRERREGREVKKEDAERLRNVVTSALGATTQYLQINNHDAQDYTPLTLQPDDVIAVDSDGVNEPVCGDHEYAIFIREANGNLDKALQSIMNEAVARIVPGHPYPARCSCKQRKGKNDDRSLILRPAADGMGPQTATGGGEDDFFRMMHEDPEGFALSKAFGEFIADALYADRKSLERAFELLIAAANTADEEKQQATREVALKAMFQILSQRKDSSSFSNFLDLHLSDWSGTVLKGLTESRQEPGTQKLMFDLLSRTVEPVRLLPLIHSENPPVSAWALELITGLRMDDKKRIYSAYFGNTEPLFNSQTDARGRPLEPWRTRYLDETVFDICDSTVVQDTALRLGILPRDLEVMAFYVYSDFNRIKALNPHRGDDGTAFIAEVSTHLTGNEARKILEASYYIYCLKEAPLPKETARQMAESLWSIAAGMDNYAPYSLGFYSKAALLRDEFAPKKQ